MGRLVDVAGDQLRTSVEHVDDMSKELRLRATTLSQSQNNQVTRNVQVGVRYRGGVTSVIGIDIARCGMQADADQISELFLAKMPAKPDGSEPPVSAAITCASPPASARSQYAMPARTPIRINQTLTPFSTGADLPHDRSSPQQQETFAPPSRSSRDTSRSHVWSYPPWHKTRSSGGDDHGVRI
jgi:hypothetical protein